MRTPNRKDRNNMVEDLVHAVLSRAGVVVGLEVVEEVMFRPSGSEACGILTGCANSQNELRDVAGRPLFLRQVSLQVIERIGGTARFDKGRVGSMVGCQSPDDFFGSAGIAGD